MSTINYLGFIIMHNNNAFIPGLADRYPPALIPSPKSASLSVLNIYLSMTRNASRSRTFSAASRNSRSNGSPLSKFKSDGS